jgi:hypothetical protein
MSTLARDGYDLAIPIAIETDPPTCAAIKIQDQFWLGRGEWFLNIIEGVPYIPTILGRKNPNIASIRAIFQEIILQTPGIASLKELQVNYDPIGRTFSYAFAAFDNAGALITGGDTPFLVATPNQGP